jgi:hypothetical protein
MRSSAPAGSPTRYTDPKTIDALLESSDPEAVTASGQSYQRFAAAYEMIAAELLSIRSDLHDAWTGKDAAAAQSQLREVWSAAVTVHNTANTFGVAVERHGSEYLAWYKQNKPPSTDLADAQNWMAGANERVAQSWSSLPPDLSTTLPPGDSPIDGHTPALSDSSGRATGSSKGSVRGGRAGRAVADFKGPADGGQHKTPSGGSGSQLAGLPTSGAGGIPGGGLGVSPGGGNGSGSAATAFTPVGGSASGPGPVDVFGPLGEGLGGGGTEGMRNIGAANSGAVEADAMNRPGAGPMIGGGTGSKERERSRQTWLAEDEDVWTGGIQSTPSLIGLEGGVKLPEPEAAPAEIEIDLTGDDVDLAAILDGLNASKPKDTAAEIAELKARLEQLERQSNAESGNLNPGVEERRNPDWITGGDR